MNVGSRIKKINEKLAGRASENPTYELTTKMDRWDYGFTTNIKQNPKDLVTLDEWKQYTLHRLKLAEERGENKVMVEENLASLKVKINQGNGLMCVEFVGIEL